ncbi:MAG: F0F1 ATP synthase subunit B [Methylococcales bacterium]|nr:F0F1 ATP synthase subunit B [Methylococcales bacterium]
MAIDWFTTSAQIINFLILVWLLKKLLFRPIINAMERREQGLADRLQQVETQMSEAQALKNKYEQHLQQLQIENDEVLSQARQQAETEKAESLLHLSEEIEQKKKQFADEMNKEQQELEPLISRTIAEKSLTLSHKILTKLAGQALEQQIIDHFLQHLSDLPENEKVSIRQALLEDNSAIVITHFQPDTATRQKIQNWFDSFAPDSSLLFKQRDYLVCGIALEVAGRSWEWNVDRYLTELGTVLLKSPGQ